MTIVDDEVSVDNLIEDYLTSEPNNEYIQSCDIVAFNKICEFQPLFWNMDLSSSLIWYAANQFNQSSQSSVAELSGYNQCESQLAS